MVVDDVVRDPFLEDLIRRYEHLESSELIRACYNQNIGYVCRYVRPEDLIQTAYSNTMKHYERRLQQITEVDDDV